MPGSGGQVRTWYFVKALAEMAEVTLVSLGGSGGGSLVCAEMRDWCADVIESAGPSCASKMRPEGGWPARFAAWGRALGAIVLPWRNDWSGFLGYCLQYSSHVPQAERAAWPWTRRLLADVLQMEYRGLTCLFHPPPLIVFLFRRNFEALRPAIMKQLKQERFDVLWFEHSMMYPFAAQLRKLMPDAALVCNAHNVESILHQRMAKTATEDAGRVHAGIQAKLLRSMEKEAFAACDLVLVCSEEDRKAVLQETPGTICEVIGNGVDSGYFQRPAAAQRAAIPTLLFTGTFGYGPNVEAVDWFVRNVLPLIHNEVPDCRFLIAGARASSLTEHLDLSDSRIVLVSDPHDMRPCFHAAWVVVVPLLAGGGTRLKIFEAMAMERPVVSTSLGAEGILLDAGHHALLADTPETFAAAVVRLVQDSELRTTLADHALDLIRQRFDWSILTKYVGEHVMRALNRPAGRQTR